MLSRKTICNRILMCALLAIMLSTSIFAAPKNVILMIGDGMGPDCIIAAGAYRYGTQYKAFSGKNSLALEKLANHAYATTYSTDGNGYDYTWAGGDQNYPKDNPTDSAAAATALATGQKTYNAAISVNTKKQPLKTIVEIAKTYNMKTGIITTVPFCHATPAAFGAHNENRANYTTIAHDMLFNVQPDVVMGAGNPQMPDNKQEFNYINKTDWDALISGKTPYTLIQDRAQFRKLIKGQSKKKVAGIFRNNSSIVFRGADGKKADKNLPTLSEMTLGALKNLTNTNGFFLMVEGGAIDWNNHANNLDGSIGETLAFDEAVSKVVSWIKGHGGWDENLLIVTADHETGYMNSVKATTAGNLPSMKWGTDGKWESHTNRLVDVYFQGDGSNELIKREIKKNDFERGNTVVVDNTDIFYAIKAAINN